MLAVGVIPPKALLAVGIKGPNFPAIILVSLALAIEISTSASEVLEESTGSLGVRGVLGWVRREKSLRSSKS